MDLESSNQIKSRYSTFNKNSRASDYGSIKKETLEKVQMNKGTLTDSMRNLREQIVKNQELKKNIDVMNFNNQKFAYVQLDTDIHQSIFTDNNANFQECIKMIKDYNKDIQQCKIKKKEIEDGPWKNRFYGTLQAQLWEVRFTKNRTLQKAYIDKIHEWALNQLKSQNKKKIHNAKLDVEANSYDLKKLRVKRNVRSVTGQSQQSQGGNTTLNTTQLPNITMDDTMKMDSTQHIRGKSTESGRNKTIKLQSVQNTQNILDDLNQIEEKEQEQDLRDSQIQEKTSNINQKPIPYETIKNQLSDYDKKFRTKHPEIDPPQIRLEAYKKKTIVEDKQIQDIPEVTKVEGSIVYPMPQNYLPQPEIEEFQDDENENADGDEGNDDGDVDDGQSNDPKQELLDGMDDMQLIGNGPGEEDEKEQGAIVPKIKNYTKDSVANIDVENKKIDKQFELKSNYTYYKPSDNAAEARMELKWQENRQKELHDKRQEEEIIGMINEWGITKGRLEKEINRRYESKVFGSNFNQCEYQPKKWDPKELKKVKEKLVMSEEEEKRRRKEKIERQQKLIDMELQKQQSSPNNKENKQEQQSAKKNSRGIRSQSLQTQSNKLTYQEGQLPQIKVGQFTKKEKTDGIEKQINQLKIKQVKSQYGQLIGLQRYKPQKDENDEESASEDIQPQKIVCQPSLSVYSRPINNGYRPFSAVFDIVDKENLREEQLKEIQIIKNRMAKHRINVPMKTLMDSIVIPQEHIHVPNQEGKILQSGQQLFQNEFWPAAKKKGGKKKKKR